jgi:hypothetical protein
MLEAARDPALAEEARTESLVPRELRRQHLERDWPIQVLVAREVHDARRPTAKLPFDAVTRQDSADGDVKSHG